MDPKSTDAATAIRTWGEGRFVPRSGFYAGRGPKLGDLNPEILEMIYQGIQKDVGPEQAATFVRFVNQLRDMSASAFIVAFEQFWASRLTEINVTQHDEDRNRLSGRGDALFGEAMGLLGSVMQSGPQDQVEIERLSQPIKGDFLHRHRDEIPDEEHPRGGFMRGSAVWI